jgi:beta-mannosidase
MKSTQDLAPLDWKLSGWTPHLWRLIQTMELGETPTAEIMAVPARVPGSVQQSLLDAGLIPDWNLGVNWRACEWVENRHWIYEVTLPDNQLQPGRHCRLVCMGLDYAGEVYLNNTLVGEFRGTHVPHSFDLTPHLRESGNVLRIVFDLPPRWLGQFGFTSRVREWKARFNYTWDWIPRLVQAGIWDTIRLEWSDGREIRAVNAIADYDPSATTGMLRVAVEADAASGDRVSVTLSRDGEVVRQETLSPSEAAAGVEWSGLAVEPWWPNGEGAQPLYDVHVALLDSQGEVQDEDHRRVGFRRIKWTACEGAAAEADPWLCVVNGRPIFLQGVNFPPLLPNFADVTDDRYRLFLGRYQELGANTFRVNGVGYLEKQQFYDLCDEMGLLVWQDVPLSSSGVENLAPDDEESIAGVATILESFIARRRHHACLLLWCGGNELQRRDVENRSVPLGLEHPLLARLAEVVAARDPGRRFLPSTATGPRFNAEVADYGKGLHWNVHGPWKAWDDLTGWAEYWAGDDALFRAETGAPGASSADLIRHYSAELDPMPVSASNPAWRRPLTWWIEEGQFAAEHEGRAPETLEEYVEWSQARQAKALSIAVEACKGRFPRCGGILLWTGHDCFPCAANTSILDFHGDPKPAALALGEIWRRRSQ